jgi:phthiodiolone/phenolphthiodiolone dimycocerosates ketoreductase
MLNIQVGVSGGIIPPIDSLIKVAQKNEELGYDALWWPDHLMGWHPQSIWTEDITPLAKFQANPHIYLEPFTMMASVGIQTCKARLGVVVTDIIRRHPGTIAETMLTLDHITKGRAMLGLGSGERLNVEPYGMDFRNPVGKLEEGLQIIKLLWSTQEPVDFDGKYWKMEAAVLGLKPFSDTPPPIWLAAHGPRMLTLAGKYADGWIPTKMTVDEYDTSLKRIREVAVQSGRSADAIIPGMLTYVIVDEDKDACEKMLDSFLIKGLCLLLPSEVFIKHGFQPPFEGSGFHDYIPTKFSRERATELFNKVPKEIVEYYAFHGTPEEVAEQIYQYAEKGLRDIVLWNVTPFADPSRAGRSFKALAKVKDLLKSY